MCRVIVLSVDFTVMITDAVVLHLLAEPIFCGSGGIRPEETWVRSAENRQTGEGNDSGGVSMGKTQVEQGENNQSRDSAFLCLQVSQD